MFGLLTRRRPVPAPDPEPYSWGLSEETKARLAQHTLEVRAVLDVENVRAATARAALEAVNRTRRLNEAADRRALVGAGAVAPDLAEVPESVAPDPEPDPEPTGWTDEAILADLRSWAEDPARKGPTAGPARDRYGIGTHRAQRLIREAVTA